MALDLELSSSQYGIKTSPTSDLRMNSDSWFECWLNPESGTGGTQQTMFSRYDGGSNLMYILYATDNAGNFFRSSNGTSGTIHTVDATPFPANGNGWVHWAARRRQSDGLVIFYQNGFRIGSSVTGPTSIFNGTAPFMVGARNTTPAFFLDGMIQEIRLWNTFDVSIRNFWNRRASDWPEIINHANLVERWALVSDGTSKTGSNDLTFPNGSTFVNSDPSWLYVPGGSGDPGRDAVSAGLASASASIAPTGRSFVSLSGTAAVAGRFAGVDLTPSTPDATAPTIENIVPTPGTTILRTQIIEFDVMDETSLAHVALYVSFPDGSCEVAYDGGAFRGLYRESPNEVNPVTGGFHVRLRRRGGWPDSPKVEYAVLDGGANLAVVV